MTTRSAVPPLLIEVTMREELSLARHTIDSHLASLDIEPEQRRDIVLCASEAIANALLHSGNDPAWPVKVEVRAGTTIYVAVTDYGRWKQEAPGHVGRGLQIVQSLATTFAIRSAEAGTTVTFSFERQAVSR